MASIFCTAPPATPCRLAVQQRACKAPLRVSHNNRHSHSAPKQRSRDGVQLRVSGPERTTNRVRAEEWTTTVAAAPGTVAARHEGKNSAGSSTATLVNIAVGAGILSMPYAVSLVGAVEGVGLIVGVAAVETLTLCILCSFAEQTGATSYSSLVEKTLGPTAGTVLAVVLYLYLLLSCTAYLIIAADCLCPLLVGVAGPEAWWAARPAVVTSVGLCVTLPLSLPRTLSAVAGVSAFKVWAILFVVGAVVVHSTITLAAPDYDWQAVHATLDSPPGLCVALPILAFGFQCHTAAIDVWNELESDSGSSRSAISSSSSSCGAAAGGPSAKLRSMVGVGVASLGALAAFYCIMGVSGYLAFPQEVDSNIMNSFPQADPLMQVVRAAVSAIAMAAFPVNHIPARSTVMDLLSRQMAANDNSIRSSARACLHSDDAYAAETFFFCGAATVVALTVSDLGAMFQLIGGTAAALLIFGVPGALLIQAALGMPAAGGTGASSGMDQWRHKEQQQRPGWHRGGLFAAGAALELITVSSWGATLYNMFG